MSKNSATILRHYFRDGVASKTSGEIFLTKLESCVNLIFGYTTCRGSVRTGLIPAILLAVLPAHSQLRLTEPAGTDKGERVGGVTVQGYAKVTIKEWSVPGANSMPEGIFSNKRDGSTWYSAEATNILGRFDPKTEKFEEFHLRPGTNPNSLVEHSGSGVQSTVYFTSRDGGYIGEFDPNTRDVREFRIPGGRIRLQDLTFDPNGVIWFTAAKAHPPEFPQGSDIGSLNLFSSEIRLAAVPTRDANPYEVVVNSNGTVFFTELDSPRIGSVEADTMKVREYTLPNPKIGTHGMTITSDDVLWYTDIVRGYLGRFDPKTRKFEEWPSPSGPNSRPAAITSVDGIIWYTESGTEPDMLVRFDPANRRFQSWPIPGGGGVGKIYAEADGSLWLTRPKANTIFQVITEDKQE
jgi:virginiamycin B lyase